MIVFPYTEGESTWRKLAIWSTVGLEIVPVGFCLDNVVLQAQPSLVHVMKPPGCKMATSDISVSSYVFIWGFTLNSRWFEFSLKTQDANASGIGFWKVLDVLASCRNSHHRGAWPIQAKIRGPPKKIISFLQTTSSSKSKGFFWGKRMGRPPKKVEKRWIDTQVSNFQAWK